MITENQLGSIIVSIDLINANDPRMEDGPQGPIPKELLYSQRMSTCLHEFLPNPDPVLQIACRAQHIRRWDLPREQYPQGKEAYHQWRNDLMTHHATVTDRILQQHDIEPTERNAISDLLQKKQLKSNPLTQVLEDVICLVFLQYELTGFSSKHSEEKLIHILQKTWSKMSAAAHERALQLSYSESHRRLLEKALAGSQA